MADRNQIYSKVVETAWKDEAFRRRLLADPKAALKQIDVVIPDHIDVRVHEESPSTLHLVIPRDPATSELSDAELDGVSGGGTLDSWGPGFC
ncbi:MAG: NHLP leader peptide family RiPP precursor [Vicinamibacterales bacterium]